MNVSEDLHLVMAEARKLSIQYRHGFIDYAHLFVGVLIADCEARAFCRDIDAEKWKAGLQNEYPATENDTMDDDMPLTLFAEYVVFHANRFVKTHGDPAVSSVHLLLALLCVKCAQTEFLNKRGVNFEDVAEQHYGKQIRRILPSIPLLRKGAYPRWRQFFMRGDSKKEKAQKLYDQACYLYRYELYADCVLVCEAGLSLVPGHFDHSYLQFLSFLYGRAFESALNCVHKLPDYTRSDSFRFTLGYIYDELGEYEEAARIFDELLSNNPLNASALNNRGFNLSRQARYAEAVPYYEKAISIDPTAAFPLNNLGFAKYKLGHVEEALGLIDKSLELDKCNSFAYKYKGIIYLEQNDRNKAMQNFLLALRYGYTKKYGNEVLELINSMKVNN